MKKSEPPHRLFYFWDDSSRESSGYKYAIDHNAPKNKYGNHPRVKFPIKRTKKVLSRFKKMEQDKVNKKIEDFIDSLPAEYELFSKEKLSRIFRISQSQIHEALASMNKKGKMNKPLHRPPHDNNRERRLGLGYGGFDGWGPDQYYRNFP